MHSTTVKIKTCNSLSNRSYISININGKRYKEYTGHKLDLDIRPNSSTSIKERDDKLRILEYEFIKAIERNTYPPKNVIKETPVTRNHTLSSVLKVALQQKLAHDLTPFYKRNLQYIYNDFIEFLNKNELDADIRDLDRGRVQEFLLKYNSSGTYYMNKRRDLNVLFSQISKNINIKLSIVCSTDKRKVKAHLHKIYDAKKINVVLEHLKSHHFNLYLCCLISYGCFLRPHKEVRNLSKSHFKNNYTEIHLSGDENKSGRIRIVYVPEYVRKELMTRLVKVNDEDNIFSQKKNPFNEAYFNTAWTRQFKIMKKESIIEDNQTMYSFRHTAAVNVYKKTKDLHVLQQLLGHSDMIVTLKYLRGLGVHNMDELKHVMPEL